MGTLEVVVVGGCFLVDEDILYVYTGKFLLEVSFASFSTTTTDSLFLMTYTV